ncbi:hypothetical protein C8Q80DRAFT_1205396 [Daedaleopsis nitida]|nr:hypothetical protein C8Q80DRAFT_1205396 [Daedaleopsis nitida]
MLTGYGHQKTCIGIRADTDDQLARDPRSYMDFSFVEEDESRAAKVLGEAFPPLCREEDDLQSDSAPSLSHVSLSCTSTKTTHANSPLPETQAGHAASPVESAEVHILRGSDSNALWPQSRVWGIDTGGEMGCSAWPSRFRELKKRTVTRTRVRTFSAQEDKHLATGRPRSLLLRNVSCSPNHTERRLDYRLSSPSTESLDRSGRDGSMRVLRRPVLPRRSGVGDPQAKRVPNVLGCGDIRRSQVSLPPGSLDVVIDNTA